MKIGVIGAGRLGICFALLCEEAGYSVAVSDVREDYIQDIQNKKITTSEPEVNELLNTSENITATTSNLDVIRDCDVVYTLVATPSLPSGDYDVSAVWKVINDIIDSGVKNKAFVVGCTTNPGDCARFQEKLKDYGWQVFYNPEFIAQGSIIKDLRRADMVLIGGERGEVYEQLCELYIKIQETVPKISIMSTTAAELVKLAVNCFLTTKISYANMVGEVMTLAGLEDEITEVLSAIGDDSRVGRKYLNYGYGFGGPCLPRDNRSFAAYAKKLGLEYNLGATTDNFNDEHARFLLEYFIRKNERNLPFCFHYVSYKEGTDIITESQQYRLCLDLLDSGYKVYVVEDYVQSQCDERIQFGIPNEEVFWVGAMNELLDKNKSVYKLRGIGPIYYLNLDGQPDRREYMESQFKYWEIENYTRISAYDGREDDLSDIISGRYPEMMTSGEIGCVTSHLKAIKHWYETTDSPYAVIMEDDCSLDIARYWNFTWNDFYGNIPYDWDIVQIAIICTGDIHVKLHKRFVNDFSTACYLINRHHAEKLLKHHVRGDKYKLDNGVKPRPVADDLIYNSGNTYSIPLLLYRTELGSSIHPEHVDAFHKGNYQAQSQFWEQNGASIDIKDYMNYDPYLGRITENSAAQQNS